MRIVWLTVVAVIAAGVTACAPAGGNSPHPAAVHAWPASPRPSATSARPSPSAASATPRPSASPVIQGGGAPGGVKAHGAELAHADPGQAPGGRDSERARP